jgi:transposase-like protein
LLSEQRAHRQFTPDQKAEIGLAGLRGDRSLGDVCREDQIAETLYDQWRERLLDGGRAALANATDGTRMVAALATRELARPVNRKRVQRVMRTHRLLQPTRDSDVAGGQGSSASVGQTS